MTGSATFKLTSVSLEGVARAYGRRYALYDVSHEFTAGTCTAILGQNGAGKTTLLNVLATLEMPSRGRVLYNDVPGASIAVRHRYLIGWLGHELGLYGDLTGRENLRFFAEMYGLSQSDERASRWLRRVGLEDAADRPVATYSRGMAQRLSLARTFLHAPQLLLLDEPFTGLDQESKTRVTAILKQLLEQGTIIILVTHDLSIDPTLLTRVVEMSDGRFQDVRAHL